MQLFLINKNVEVIIDRYINPKQKVKIRILQSLPILSISFLIYIRWVFDIVTTTLPNIISLLFIDDLGFLVNQKSIHKVAIYLNKIREVMLKEEASNMVTYNIPKTKVVLFWKGQKSRYIVEISAKILIFSKHNILFNDKATR